MTSFLGCVDNGDRYMETIRQGKHNVNRFQNIAFDARDIFTVQLFTVSCRSHLFTAGYLTSEQ